MLFKVEIPAKAFGTYATRKRFPFVVGVHVEGKVVNLMKSFVAYVAFVSLFSAMGQSVVLVIPFLMESFPAEFADEWLVTCVDPRVGVQGR
jgi:hypothetical protein